jgi:hypothetical protein
MGRSDSLLHLSIERAKLMRFFGNHEKFLDIFLFIRKMSGGVRQSL